MQATLNKQPMVESKMDETEISTRYSKAGHLRDEKKYAEALSIFLELAEYGDTGSMLNAANMYCAGEGTELNYDKALALEKRAAAAGDTLAFFNLAVSYRHLGDARTARYWFVKAVADGDGDASLELAKLYMVSDKETENIIKYLRFTCESYDVFPASQEEAEELLAEFLSPSRRKKVQIPPTPPHPAKRASSMDKAEILKKFRKAETLHDKKEFAEALEIFLELAEYGNTAAMLKAADMYSAAEGTELDYDKALELTTRAADAGDTLALIPVGLIYRHWGDARAARRWFEKALAAGSSEAALYLAKMYMVSDREAENIIKYLSIACESEYISPTSREEAQTLLAEYQQDGKKALSKRKQ